MSLSPGPTASQAASETASHGPRRCRRARDRAALLHQNRSARCGRRGGRWSARIAGFVLVATVSSAPRHHAQPPMLRGHRPRARCPWRRSAAAPPLCRIVRGRASDWPLVAPCQVPSSAVAPVRGRGRDIDAQLTLSLRLGPHRAAGGGRRAVSRSSRASGVRACRPLPSTLPSLGAVSRLLGTSTTGIALTLSPASLAEAVTGVALLVSMRSRGPSVQRAASLGSSAGHVLRGARSRRLGSCARTSQLSSGSGVGQTPPEPPSACAHKRRLRGSPAPSTAHGPPGRGYHRCCQFCHDGDESL